MEPSPDGSETETPAALVWDGDPANLTSPLDHVDGFRFELTLTGDGEEERTELVIRGVAAAADAVTCVFSDPSLVDPTMGEITAAGDVAWFEDGWITPVEQDRRDHADDLSLCPGAGEFWEDPPWRRPEVSLSDTGTTEEVDGEPTTVLSISMEGDAPVGTGGTMWVTGAGWPIRLEMGGPELGALLGADPLDDTADPDAGPARVELSMSISDVDDPAIAVRSPSGAFLAGPLGDVQADVAVGPMPLAATSGLRAAGLSDCHRFPIVPAIVADGSPEELNLAAIRSSTSSGDANVTMIHTIPGLPRSGSRMSTSGDPEARVTHALLYYRHIAPRVAVADWSGFGPPSWWSADQALAIPVSRGVGATGFGDDAPDGPGEIVVWDGRSMEWSQEVGLFGGQPATTHDVGYLELLPPPPDEGATLAADDAAIGWVWLGDWVDATMRTLPLVRHGDVQALADLKVLHGMHDDARAVACSVLATIVADSTDGSQTEAEAVRSIEEFLAVENVLLLTEYVHVIGAHLDRPGVDWLAGPDVDLLQTMDGTDTDGTFLFFFTDAATSLDGLLTPEDVDDSYDSFGLG